MSMLHEYALADGAPSLCELKNPLPLSEPKEWNFGGQKMMLRFRPLSDDDRKELKMDAEVYISALYAEKMGIQLAPGEISRWIGTVNAEEAILTEWELRLILAATMYEVPGQPGQVAPAFAEEWAREHLTTEQKKSLAVEIVSHSVRFDPDEWSDEVFAEMMEVAKKKDCARLISYGAARLTTYIIAREEQWTISETTRSGDTASSDS